MDEEETKRISKLLGMTEEDHPPSQAKRAEQSARKFKKYSILKPCTLKESNSTTPNLPEEKHNA